MFLTHGFVMNVIGKRKMDKVMNTCLLFGDGWVEGSDICQSCKRAKRCREFTLYPSETTNEINVNSYINQPKAKEQPMIVRVSKPVVREGYLVMSLVVKIDMVWFRKYLGSGDFT